MILDFHSHLEPENGILRCISHHVDEIEAENLSAPCSLGIHPWYIHDEDVAAQMDTLRTLAKRPEVRLIGECGLDRTKGPSLKIQEQVFIENIKLGSDLKKPLVLHIVQCFSELLAIQKLLRPPVPMVVHGFNKSPELAQQLLAKGFYLSFGQWAMTPAAEACIRSVPVDKLFLETDDSALDLLDLYAHIAKIKNLTCQKLAEQIMANWFDIIT